MKLFRRDLFPIRLPWKQIPAWNAMMVIKLPSTRRDINTAVSVLMGLEWLAKSFMEYNWKYVCNSIFNFPIKSNLKVRNSSFTLYVVVLILFDFLFPGKLKEMFMTCPVCTHLNFVSMEILKQLDGVGLSPEYCTLV